MLHIKQKTEADTSKKEIGIKKLVRLLIKKLVRDELVKLHNQNEGRFLV